MIHMFFVTGMFTSTLEYVLRCYTNEYQPIVTEVLGDGSMHGYERQAHPNNLDALKSFFANNPPKDAITAPQYPFTHNHLPEILEQWKPFRSDQDHCILIYAPDIRAAELNMLFQYYKIAIGSLNEGLGIFADSNAHNVVNWNKDYTHWSDMQPWEWREWFSLFYVSWSQEWIDSKHQVDDDFLILTNTEILYDTEHSVKKIMAFCQLTEKPGLADFVRHWQSKQQYIVDEFNLLDKIVSSTVANQPMSWSTINIISEAIVQQRLREIGYEIRCNGLNKFPTDSETLYNLLEKC